MRGVRAAAAGVGEVACQVLGAMDDRTIIVAVAERVVVGQYGGPASPAAEHSAGLKGLHVSPTSCIVGGIVATLLPRASCLLTCTSVSWTTGLSLQGWTTGLGADPHALPRSHAPDWARRARPRTPCNGSGRSHLGLGMHSPTVRVRHEDGPPAADELTQADASGGWHLCPLTPGMGNAPDLEGLGREEIALHRQCSHRLSAGPTLSLSACHTIASATSTVATSSTSARL
jgi:hypothetical protein